MTETIEDKTARLLEEKAVLAKSLQDLGVQMIFIKLKNMAKVSVYDYDNCDFNTDRGREMAHRIQARRYVILQEIPRIIDEIINVDIPREEGKLKWRFHTWLKQIQAFFNSNNR